MESIEQIEQLIAQTESEISQLEEKIVQEATGAGSVETEIELLREEVAKVEVPAVSGDEEQVNQKIQSVNGVLAVLSEQIGSAKTVEERRKQQALAEIDRLKAHRAKLQVHLEEKTTIDISQEAQASEKLSAAQRKLTHQNQQIQALLADLEREGLELSALQTEIDAFHSQGKKIVESAEEETQKWKAEESRLLEELKKLEQQVVEIDHSINHSVADHQTEKQAILKELSQHKIELATQKELSKRLASSKIATEAQIKQIEQETAFEQANIEEFLRVITIEAQRFDKTVSNLKINNKAILESIKEQEKRQRDEEAKSKAPKKSTKDLINKQEKEHQKLSRELQREKSRLENEIKLKSTYISTDNLNILQREYERHRQPNGPSLEQKTALKDRLVRDNKALIGSINNLKRLIKDSEAKESKLLAESKKKGDILTTDKLAIDKQFTSNNSKLNEYLKQFPNHATTRLEKVKKANQEKHLAKQAQIISSTVDDPSPSENRKSGKLKFKQSKQTNNEDINNIISQFNDKPSSEQNFQQTTWFKRRSLKDFELQPERPFYKNLYFQAATLLFGLLVVVMIS